MCSGDEPFDFQFGCRGWLLSVHIFTACQRPQSCEALEVCLENRNVDKEEKEGQHARCSADTCDYAVVHSTNKITISKGILRDCRL
jgi:hypothetical protein